MDFLGLLGSVSDALDSSIVAVVTWATAQMQILYGDIAAVNAAFGGVTQTLGSIFGSLWSWLTSLWKWLHDTIIVKLRDLIQRIHDRLKEIFGPLLDQVRAIIAEYRRLWLQYVKPIYDFLQRIRSALVIFRLLGFKWAQRLDARIVALETAISSAFLATLKNLNTLADWLNYLIDPFGLFQPSIWLGSIARSIGAIIGIAVDRMNDPGFTFGADPVTLPANYYDAGVYSQRMAARLKIGLMPEDTAIIQELAGTLSELGYDSFLLRHLE